MGNVCNCNDSNRAALKELDLAGVASTVERYPYSQPVPDGEQVAKVAQVTQCTKALDVQAHDASGEHAEGAPRVGDLSPRFGSSSPRCEEPLPEPPHGDAAGDVPREGEPKAPAGMKAADDARGAALEPADAKKSEALTTSTQAVADPTITFTYRVRKVPGKSLGLDVKHLKGSLEVVDIIPEGVVNSTNLVLRCQNFPGMELQVGDIIQKVNGVGGDDDQMVAECRSKDQLVFEVLRPPPP